MKFAVYCFAIAAASTAQAQEIPRYAQTSADIANAIRGGDTSPVMPLLPALSEEEKIVIGKLSGCTGTVGPQANKNFVQFNYSCPSAVVAHFSELRLGLRFTDTGDVFAVELNPIFGGTATAGSVAGTDLEKPSVITRRFARAVKNGEDPTLGGLIPIAEFQRSQLDAIGGTKFSYREIPGENQHPILFHGSGLDRDAMRQVSVHFDDAGRPLGISIVKANVRVSGQVLRK